MNRREFLRQTPALAAIGVAASRALASDALPLAKPSQPRAPLLFQGAQLHNIDHLEPNPNHDGFRLNRFPIQVWEKLSTWGKARAYAAAGAELRFNLVDPEAKVVLRYAETRSAAVRDWPVLAELYQGDFLVRYVELRPTWTEISFTAPANLAQLQAERPRDGFDPALVRVVLPYLPETQIRRIDGAVAPPRPEQVPARSYLAYGSSITQGFHALRTGDTYPALVGRALGMNVFNLGLGAAALLEPEMAEWIAGRNDWDVATLELGANLLRPVSTADFARRVDVFLNTIAKSAAGRPVYAIDLFTSGKTLEAEPKREEFRRVVRDAVRALRQPNVRHLEGKALFARTTGLSFDLLHPSSDGFRDIATRLGVAMQARL